MSNASHPCKVARSSALRIAALRLQETIANKKLLELSVGLNPSGSLIVFYPPNQKAPEGLPAAVDGFNVTRAPWPRAALEYRPAMN